MEKWDFEEVLFSVFGQGKREFEGRRGYSNKRGGYPAFGREEVKRGYEMNFVTDLQTDKHGEKVEKGLAKDRGG
ncbi:MAG: hypothetical protein ABIA47_01920 [bacterium]